MDFLKDMKVRLSSDSRLEQAFYDWALRLGGNDDGLADRPSAQEYLGGYSFAERESFRTAVEKMLD